MEILDPDTRAVLGPDQVGEVWISGPQVATAPDGAHRVGGTLGCRTGDLGFREGGELFLVGRSKERFQLAGENFYSVELEAVVAAVDDRIRPGRTAVFVAQLPGAPAPVPVVLAECRAEAQEETDSRHCAVPGPPHRLRARPGPGPAGIRGLAGADRHAARHHQREDPARPLPGRFRGELHADHPPLRTGTVMRAGPQPQDAPRTELLPENLAQDVVDEIDAYLERVPHGTSCLATGSLIEGFGNSNSDIDLYVIQPSGSTATKPIAIGIRDSRYVDVEYLNLAALHKLADAFRDTTPDEAPQALTLRDFDRYYRLSVAARLKVTGEAEAALDRCSSERSATLFARWSLAQAAAYLARATVARALQEVPRAVILARQAAVWRATSQLADEGEAYPRLKWVTVKAARRFGADTPGYRSCLQGYDVTPPVSSRPWSLCGSASRRTWPPAGPGTPSAGHSPRTWRR